MLRESLCQMCGDMAMISHVSAVIRAEEFKICEAVVVYFIKIKKRLN